MLVVKAIRTMNPISRIAAAPRPSRASMEGVSPLMYSCQQGDIHQVRQLIQRKVGLHYLDPITLNLFGIQIKYVY